MAAGGLLEILRWADYTLMKILPLVECSWARSKINKNIKPNHGKIVNKSWEEINYFALYKKMYPKKYEFVL